MAGDDFPKQCGLADVADRVLLLLTVTGAVDQPFYYADARDRQPSDVARISIAQYWAFKKHLVARSDRIAECSVRKSTNAILLTSLGVFGFKMRTRIGRVAAGGGGRKHLSAVLVSGTRFHSLRTVVYYRVLW